MVPEFISSREKGKYLLTGIVFLSLVGFLYFNSKISKSQLASSLILNKTATVSSVVTGEEFIYTLQYSCTSLTEDCLGTVITDPLPPEVEFIELVGSLHTASESYNAVTHTVTFNLISPLDAGTSGQVLVRVRFPNGETPNGAIASNTATISASNAPSESSTFDVSAIAAAKPNLEKEFVSGGSAGGYTTYQTKACNDYYTEENGTLTLTDFVIVDTLPVGSIFVDTIQYLIP